MSWAVRCYGHARRQGPERSLPLENAWFDDQTLTRWIEAGDHAVLTELFDTLPSQRFANLKPAIIKRWPSWSGRLAARATLVLLDSPARVVRHGTRARGRGYPAGGGAPPIGLGRMLTQRLQPDALRRRQRAAVVDQVMLRRDRDPLGRDDGHRRRKWILSPLLPRPPRSPRCEPRNPITISPHRLASIVQRTASALWLPRTVKIPKFAFSPYCNNVVVI
jgi:hypothetical protein